MFRKLAALSVVAAITAAVPAVLDPAPADFAAGHRFTDSECRPSYRTVVC